MTASRWRGPERRRHNTHPPWRWRRLFPGHKRELSQMRRWLSALLPDCPARDDLLSIATELASNALQHTASGRDGGWFAVEITRQAARHPEPNPSQEPGHRSHRPRQPEAQVPAA